MKVADEGERSTRLDAIARSLSLSGWMAFIGFFATSDDGHERTFSPLIDRPTSLRLKEDHRAAVAAASAEVLATERRLDRLIAVLLTLPEGVQRLQALAAADGFLPALLASMVDEFRPGSKSLALPWRWLVERLGETLAARVLALEADGGAERSPSEAEAVTLAARYALGESLHDTSPCAQPDEAADGDEADPPAANERGDQ